MMLIFAYATTIFITDVPDLFFVVPAGPAITLSAKLFQEST